MSIKIQIILELYISEQLKPRRMRVESGGAIG